MHRRNFVAWLSAGSASALIAPRIASAASNCEKMAGGVFYTKKNPGRWSGKVGGHLPQLEISKTADGIRLKVMTAHEMRGFEHYIVKHVVLDQDYRFIAEKMFDPQKDQVPLSEFQLGSFRGRIHVLSVCNKHDTWLNHTEI